MYGRTYGSQAEADAANRMIMQAQDDKPDRTIDKEIAGPDLAYDDALALTQGVLPPQFSGAVPPDLNLVMAILVVFTQMTVMQLLDLTYHLLLLNQTLVDKS